MKLPQTGGCLCGKIRYEITEAPRLVYTCHCVDCQRITSNAFSMAIVVTDVALRIAGIEPCQLQRTADSGRVPRNDKAAVPISPERVRRLRKHLVVALRALRTMKNPEHSVSPLRPEPEGFAARVARTACSLCKGWCCRNGEDHAFLDEGTMARVRCARWELDVRAVLRLYVERVPKVGYEDSCIFHGKQGCTLDRSLRSDVCNSYFCGGLQVYMADGEAARPTMIIAGVGDKMRTSPILMP
jgi:hypothetical protein